MTVAEKAGIYISVAVIVMLLCLIVFSKNGVLDHQQLEKKEAAMTVQTGAVELENRKLEKEIKRLKTDMEYIKHIARHEHDMAQEEELIFKQKRKETGASDNEPDN